MIKLGASKVKFYLGDKKVKSIYQGPTKVWSGASLVSYYDGATLMGTEEVEEGEDVLHPSFSTSKSGYTLYGWTTMSGSTERVEALTANGEPMILYAIYIINSLIVVDAGTILQPQYVSGNCKISQQIKYQNNTWGAGFSLDKKKYQSGTIVAKAGFPNAGTGNLEVGRASLDGVQFVSAEGGGSGSRNIAANNGSHSLSLFLISYGDYVQTGNVFVTITLTNPIAWA